MKKTIAAIAAAMLAASCSSPSSTPENGGPATFTLRYDKAVAASVKGGWQAGDSLVFHDSRNTVAVSIPAGAISPDGLTATLTVEGLDISAAYSGNCYAAYPAEAFNPGPCNGNRLCYSTFYSSNAPLAVGHGSDSEIVMHNICGGISFIADVPGADRYRISAPGGEALAFSSMDVADDPSAAAPAIDYFSNNTINNVYEIAGDFASGKEIRAYFAEGQDFPDGLEILFGTAEGWTHTVHTPSGLEVVQGLVTPLGDLTLLLEPYVQDPGTDPGTDPGSGEDDGTLCKPEYLGLKPAVIAYYTEYSTDLPDPLYVTHVNYAHGRFKNPKTGDGGITVASPDLLKKVVALKSQNPDLKVLLMIGGWGERADGFSVCAADPEKRALFCSECKKHIDTYGLDGIDIDWEYPGGGPSTNGQSKDDAKNFNILLKELREAIGNTKIISYASSSSAKYCDFKGALEYLDYVNVMTYDMGSPPYHNSTLYKSSLTRSTSCESSIAAHVSAGVPADRMTLGVPFYGHGTSPYASDVKYNEMAGIFSNPEYEGKNIRRWDDTAKVPYLVDTAGTMLLGYDDAESVEYKGKFAVEKGLMGVMFWEYLHDDSQHTLLHSLHDAVRGNN